MKKQSWAIFLLLFYSAITSAKTAEELLAAGTSQEQGEAIAIEFDERDIGWEDADVELQMVLKNSAGREVKRKQRIRILQNPGRVEGDKSLITFDYPRDVKGTAFLSYAKILEADSQWIFLPALKRVKRISSNNKSGPFVGSEFAYEDITGNEIGKYSWEYLTTEACGNEQCFKLKTIPKYKHSGYSKRLVWIDTSHFRIQKIEFFDRKDQLLKTQTNKGYKQYLNKFWRADVWEMVNHQHNKSTILNFNAYQFKTGLKARDFTRAALTRSK